MHVRCPHCHNPIEIVDEVELSDVECPSCGSGFSLVGDGKETESYEREEKTIGHFTLVRQLGVGAFGSVWQAKDSELDRKVAIKIPRKGQLTPSEAEQFLREARSAAQLKHPNIVSVHEVGREDGQVYIVSGLIHGVTLADRLSEGPLSVRESAELVAKIAEAVHHAHEQGVVHRDLKPSNIMLDADNEPHVMDFGLAKREAGEITMTVEGAILGTPLYMSPEQAQGEGHDADARSDVYSLGVILFECLTGELPFRGNKRMLLYKVINEEAPSPRTLENAIPRDVETICLRCLRKEPDRRFESASALSDDLKRWMNREPILSRPVSRIEWTLFWLKRRPSFRYSLATAIVVISLAVITLVALRQSNLASRCDDAVSTMSATYGPGVPIAIKQLRSLPEDMLTRRLNSGFMSASGQPRLSLAYGIAALPGPPEDVLTALVAGVVDAETSTSEVVNIVQALKAFNGKAIKRVRDEAETATTQKDYRAKTRLAIIAWHLGETSLAREMLQAFPVPASEGKPQIWDPVQRTRFIAEFGDWSGELSRLAAIEFGDNHELKSGIALSLGGIESPSSKAKATWGKILSRWHLESNDGGTHSASEWALRQWGLTPPLPNSTATPELDQDWWQISDDLTMIKICAGTVHSEEGEVTVQRAFWLSSREVTVRQFQRFVVATRHKWVGPATFEALSATDQLEHPVQGVNWYEAVLYCNWLSRQHGMEPCYEINPIPHTPDQFDVSTNNGANGFRLPLESEWEFACRAKTTTRFSFGDEAHYLPAYGVFSGNSFGQTAGVGKLRCNGWGLFDMHGNVYEWCFDEYDDGRHRVSRSGDWNSNATRSQSSKRLKSGPAHGFDFLGFRVAAGPPGSGKGRPDEENR